MLIKPISRAIGAHGVDQVGQWRIELTEPLEDRLEVLEVLHDQFTHLGFVEFEIMIRFSRLAFAGLPAWLWREGPSPGEAAPDFSPR